jgi:transcriptional regulator GlxA family with amidase domain
LLTSVCTGSWIYAEMGLLDGIPATSRKEPDGTEAKPPGKVPLERLTDIAPACQVSRARVVDARRIITAGGIASDMELGVHLLRRAGYDEDLIGDVARVMEYQDAYALFRDDVQVATPASYAA